MTEMTEAQKTIADTVRAHLWYFVGNLGVPGMPDRRGYKCGCGWSTGDPDEPGFEDPHGHVAAEIEKALGGLTREERVIEGVFEMGVPESAVRWVSGWSEVQS